MGNIPILARKRAAKAMIFMLAWLAPMVAFARPEAAPGEGLPAGIVILLIVIVLALGLVIQSSSQRFR